VQGAKSRTASQIRAVRLATGRLMPALGQGTWGMGEQPGTRADEEAALRYGIDLGLTLIDTAELYGDGEAERIVGAAIRGRREEVFVVSKVLPYKATRKGTVEACEASLRRLGTEHLDLYLLHWRGDVPLAETFDAFDRLKSVGKIVDYGVSNFDVGDVQVALLVGADEIAADQVLYNLKHRGIEYDLLPWCRARCVPIMAYSPMEHSLRDQRALLDHPVVVAIAARHDVTPAQVALGWLLADPDVVAIPKAAKPEHIRENRAALDLRLTEEDLDDLDRAFPPPDRKVPLEMR
jgi:diketogulonate reductase-like aldo/keto reductase